MENFDEAMLGRHIMSNDNYVIFGENSYNCFLCPNLSIVGRRELIYRAKFFFFFFGGLFLNFVGKS